MMKFRKAVSIILALALFLSNFVLPTVNVAAETGNITIHYYNENNWDEPYIYYYTDTKSPAAWPGAEMKSEGDGWYTYTITKYSSARVHFNNLKETVEKSNKKDIKKCFVFDEEDYSAWIVFDKEAER